MVESEMGEDRFAGGECAITACPVFRYELAYELILLKNLADPLLQCRVP